MGNYPASVGKDNDELVDNLINGSSVFTQEVENVMRLVDRGLFLPENEHENAYKDAAWRSDNGDPGYFHLSAPCIYASVLENLDIKKGMSFLNIGSGIGYLSSMVGYMIGSSGINHGIELYENVISCAEEKIALISHSPESCAFDWCVPHFMAGNAFQINTEMRYDRIYVGALVPRSKRSFFCNFLKVGGIIIMPYGNYLHRVFRHSETEFFTKDVSSVSFSRLISVSDNPTVNKPVEISLREPQSLAEMCRTIIRNNVRKTTAQFYPVKLRFYCEEKKRLDRKRRNTNSSSTSDVARSRRVRMRHHSPDSQHPHVILFNVREANRNQHEDEHDDHPVANADGRGRLLALAALLQRRISRHQEARDNQAQPVGLYVRVFMENAAQDREEEEHQGQEGQQHEDDENQELDGVRPYSTTWRAHYKIKKAADLRKIAAELMHLHIEFENNRNEIDKFGFRFIPELGVQNNAETAETNVAEQALQSDDEDDDSGGLLDDSLGSDRLIHQANSSNARTEDESLSDEEEMFTAEEDYGDSEDMLTARDGTPNEENANKKNEIKESEQTKQLKKFQQEFVIRLHQLPVNAQMRKFLMFDD